MDRHLNVIVTMLALSLAVLSTLYVVSSIIEPKHEPIQYGTPTPQEQDK